jgi:hypothetical protein
MAESAFGQGVAMTRVTRNWTAAAALLVAFGVGACSGNGSPTSPDSGTSASAAPTGGGTPSPAGTGSLAIHLTDSPFSDARALLVTFNSVSVHRSEGDAWETIPFASGSTRTCDLKKLDGPTDVLGVGSLPAGHYTQVRLVVASAAIYFDNPSVGGPCASTIAAPQGEFAPVDIPSGEVKLNHQFTLTSAGTTMLLDFDGDQSVRQTGGGNGNGNGNGRGSNSGATSKYMMSPVIRVVSVN